MLFLLLVKALIKWRNYTVSEHLVQRHTVQKIYKSYQTNECCRHKTVEKNKTAAIWLTPQRKHNFYYRFDIWTDYRDVNKYAPC